jgi:hypothetical protein
VRKRKKRSQVATEVIEFYRCALHGVVRWFRFEMSEDGEGLQLCPYCARLLEVIDMAEAREMVRKQNESE